MGRVGERMHDDRGEWNSTLENGTKICCFLLAMIGGQTAKRPEISSPACQAA